MKKIHYVFIISLVFLIIVPAHAAEEYIIKKGDTLWDISNSKLQDFFLWPKLWKENPQIKNPDLIYPGQKIRIPSKEELGEAPVEEKMPIAVGLEKPAVEKQKPTTEVLEEKPKEYIVNKDTYILSGWICKELTGIGEITSTPDSRTTVGKNDSIYLKIKTNTDNDKKFLVMRTVKKIKHPKTGKFLGYLVKIPGIVEVTGMDNGTPKARVLTSFEEIQVGDVLLPYKEMEPSVVTHIANGPDVTGYIVESYRNTTVTSAGEIIYLDKGEKDGLGIGNVFSIFSETPVKRPIGTLQVIALQPTTSKAVILKTSQEATIGDMWGKE